MSEKPVLRERPLLESCLSIQEKGSKELIEWCQSRADFVKEPDSHEYIFWIPPFDGYENWLKKTYGENIPEKIYEILVLAVHEQAGKSDQGFLSIPFV